MIAKNNYLSEGVRIYFNGKIGVVQVVYKETAYVRFDGGKMSCFSLDGKFLKDYVKSEGIVGQR